MATLPDETRMILFEKNNVELDYHPELKVLEVRWIGVLDDPVVTHIREKIVEAPIFQRSDVA